MKITFTAHTDKPTAFTLPLHYYPIYKAYTADSRELKIYSGEKHRLIVEVPAGDNDITVKYADQPLWRIIDIISLIASILFIFQIYYERNY